MFDLTGITFIKVHGIISVYNMKHSYLIISPQKAGMQSPLTGSWVPGEEDDKETQETVRRMLGEIRGGGEEAARGTPRPWTTTPGTSCCPSTRYRSSWTWCLTR